MKKKKKRNLMLKTHAVKWSALKLYIQVTFYRLSRLYVRMFRNAYTQRHTLPPPPLTTTKEKAVNLKGCGTREDLEGGKGK